MLSVLICVYASHYLDRSIISILQEAIRTEFGLSDSQTGILTGLAFAFSYALVGIPAGWLIDRVNRKNLLSAILLLWSGATAICSIASSYLHLLLLRMFVGAAESGGSPAAMSLISDTFPKERRATAMGLFYISTALGSLVSFGLGGYVLTHYGWRTAFFIASVPGILLSGVVFFSLREPARGQLDNRVSTPVCGQDIAGPSIGAAFRYILSLPALRNLVLAMILGTTVLAGAVSWLPTFQLRILNLDAGTVGIVLALTTGVVGSLAAVTGGFFADWLGRKDARWPLRMLALAALLAAPAGMAAVAVATVGASIAFTAVFSAFSFVYLGPAYGTMLTLTPAHMRGTVGGIVQVLTNLVGYGLGPYLIGLLSDLLGGAESLRVAMMAIMVLHVWAALHYGLASRRVLDAPQYGKA